MTHVTPSSVVNTALWMFLQISNLANLSFLLCVHAVKIGACTLRQNELTFRQTHNISQQYLICSGVTVPAYIPHIEPGWDWLLWIEGK